MCIRRSFTVDVRVAPFLLVPRTLLPLICFTLLFFNLFASPHLFCCICVVAVLMQVHYSADIVGDSNPPESIHSLDALKRDAALVTPEEYDNAAEEVWAETERSMSTEAEYWGRLSSTLFDECDNMDAIAEEWEQTYFRSKGAAVSQRRKKKLPIVVTRGRRSSDAEQPAAAVDGGAATAVVGAVPPQGIPPQATGAPHGPPPPPAKLPAACAAPLAEVCPSAAPL